MKAKLVKLAAVIKMPWGGNTVDVVNLESEPAGVSISVQGEFATVSKEGCDSILVSKFIYFVADRSEVFGDEKKAEGRSAKRTEK